jgi:hypothetical protein
MKKEDTEKMGKIKCDHIVVAEFIGDLVNNMEAIEEYFNEATNDYSDRKDGFEKLLIKISKYWAVD